jgi:hypothetical protein
VKYAEPLTHYAKVYGKGIATIKRWSVAGAPLDNPDLMGEWMDHKQRKGGPKSDSFTDPYPRVALPEEPEETPAGPFELDAVSYENLPKGAAQALKRLEETETKLYQRLENALAGGRSLAIAAAREDWLKCSESLRKYDLLVEQSRRDSGELIPRQDAEMAVLMAATWLRLSVMGFISSDVPVLLGIKDAALMAKRIESGISSALTVALANSQAASAQLPAWAVEKAREGFNAT